MADVKESLIEAELRRRDERHQVENKMQTFYPEEGPMRRELYPKHMAAFAAGETHEARLIMAGNRTGKSEGIFCYELTCHLTGRYPHWWPGRRFNRPIDAWAAGKTGETTRDIIQAKLLGKTWRDDSNRFEILGLGTGMIPAECIVNTTPKSGVSNGIDVVKVRHISGGVSSLGLKSYGRNRDSFEGTEKDFIGLDEEPPVDVYDECVARTMATKPGERGGLIMITFTPLEGYTEVIKKFLETTDPGQFFIQIGWKDAPHISQEEIDRLSRKYLPSQLRARSLGEPSMGEGAIYPIDIEELLVDDFEIPAHFRRGFGMDVGKTAVVWGAMDDSTDTLYLTREYFSEQYNTTLHAGAIKGLKNEDAWIPGVIDPASLGSSQVDGQKLFMIYRGLGVNVTLAENPVQAGLQSVWVRMQAGKLKVFRSMSRWKNEFSRYHRKTRETEFGIKSEVVKKDDHEMDATRYLVVSGIQLMKCAPVKRPTQSISGSGRLVSSGERDWMV